MREELNTTGVTTDHPFSVCDQIPTLRDRLRRFLQAYWLRPENALWMTIRSLTLSDVPMVRPSADFGCGDGVFGFLHLGGTFDPAFDVFTDVTLGDTRTKERCDMFDCATEAYQPEILSSPADSIDAGVDHKASMLAKAQRLGLYEQLTRHDNNDPLPFPNDCFQTTYSNAAYWIKNIDGFLGELRRITRPDGHIILQVKLDSLSRYTLDKHRRVLGDRFLAVLAGGRLDCWPSLTDQATWETRFKKAGLHVEQATPFITRSHAHIWDVGLRPIAPMLIKMANALVPQTRAQIKEEWVARLLELAEPLCRPDLNLTDHRDEPAEIQYVLRKQ